MSDNRDKKQQNAFDALDALAGGDEPSQAPAPETPPAKPAAPKPAPKKPAPPAASEPQVEIPKVPTRPTQPPAGSGRPDTPPAVKKAPKATPARAVARSAPAAKAAKPAAAAAPKTRKRSKRNDPAKLKRRIAGLKQAEGWRQTAFPILATIGLLLIIMGIVGVVTMPSKTVDPLADTDNWDTDPDSPLAKPAIRFFVFASFPIGAIVILGGVLLVIQAARLKKMWTADELTLNGPPDEEQE
jgi:hypothetical protein